MARWFWFFVFYSFLGYLLEKGYARSTRSPRQVRKCFLLLPLCPVYGLAMCAVTAVVPAGGAGIVTPVGGAVVCTGVEYLVHLFYDRALGVRFWDYSDLRGNLAGRVCLRFSMIWGVLAWGAVVWVQPVADDLLTRLPLPALYALWLVLAADGVLSAGVLIGQGDTELLSLTALLSQERASSQSRTSR